MASTVWSSPSCSTRTVTSPRLVVAIQDPASRRISPVGFLEKTEDGYSFTYLRRVLDMPGFRPLLGFGDLERRYESPVLFPLFGQRLMNPRRADYRRYLTVLGLPADAPPLVVLGRSGGRRAGDSITLVPEPRVDEDGRTSAIFFVHGPRHLPGAQMRISRLHPEDALELRDDPTNPKNPRALLVTDEGAELGWVPDLLLDYVHHVRDAGGLSIRVAQVNSDDTPPNLRLRVRLQGRVTGGYRPFCGAEWAAFG